MTAPPSSNLVDELRRANVRGVAPPQNWTHRAIDEIERLQRERDAWESTAAQFARNADYYRGLVDEIGKSLGDAAYIADDGSRSDDILRAKVPELVKARLAVKTTGVTNEQAFAAAAVKALRGHRWCGDQYPEDGWPDVNTALALYAKLGRSPEKEPPPVHGNDGAPCSCKGHPFNCYGHPTKCGCSAVEPTYNPETVAAIKAAQASGGKAVCCQQFPDCECEPEKASDE